MKRPPSRPEAWQSLFALKLGDNLRSVEQS
jgi:hypothetical protein